MFHYKRPETDKTFEREIWGDVAFVILASHDHQDAETPTSLKKKKKEIKYDLGLGNLVG